MIMAVMGVCVIAARKPAMPSAISTVAWSGASSSATSCPRLAPIARLGVKSPPGAPDQADNQVATNFSSVHNSGTSDPSPASSVRVCAWPPPTALACVRMPITATASPQAAAKRIGCLRRKALKRSRPPNSDVIKSRANSPPIKPQTSASASPGSSTPQPTRSMRMRPKYDRLPNAATATRPAITMAPSIRPEERVSSRRDSSSMANTMPPSGVLKAAAMPAALPATSSSRALMPERGDRKRRAAYITPAAICTDGPCRPIDSPASSPPNTASALASEIFSDTSAEREGASSRGSSAASACGGPEPPAPGAKRIVAHTTSAVSAGVHSSGQKRHSPDTALKICSPASASSVKTTTDSPASSANRPTTARSIHTRGSITSLRTWPRKSGSSFMRGILACVPGGLRHNGGFRSTACSPSPLQELAMASVNKVILVGNLGRDPEMRSFPSGDQVANVTLATTDKWKDKQSGEPREHTEWHRLVFNGRLAEIAGQYLRKGSQIYVEGSIRTRKWQDQATGQDRYATEVRVDQMQMLGSRQGMGGPSDDGGGGYGGGGDGGGYDAPRRAAPAPRAASAPRAPAPAAPKPGSGFDDMDDDIPF